MYRNISLLISEQLTEADFEYMSNSNTSVTDEHAKEHAFSQCIVGKVLGYCRVAFMTIISIYDFENSPSCASNVSQIE
jgi:hypothetical protein